jgi:hypothetical protein
MVQSSVQRLQESELVALTDEKAGTLCSTEYGEIMSKVSWRFYYYGVIYHISHLEKYYMRQNTASCRN